MFLCFPSSALGAFRLSCEVHLLIEGSGQGLYFLMLWYRQTLL